MPVHPVKGGGYQWGKSGKVYRGLGAKEKAHRQEAAAHAHGYRGLDAGSKKKAAPRKRKAT